MHRFLLPPQRTPFLFLLAAAVLGVIVLLLKEPSPEDRLRSDCDLLQQKITDTNAELDALCRSTTTLLGQDSTENWRRVSDGLVSLENSGTTLLARWNGNRYWTSALPLDERVLDTTAAAQVRSGSSVYSHAGSLSRSGSVHALRLLWYQPPFENRYLHKHFNPYLGVAEGVEASTDPGLGPVVRDAKGAVLFRLQWAGDGPPPGSLSRLRSVLLLTCFALLLACLWIWSCALASRENSWLAVGVLLAVVTVVRWWSLSNGPWSVFEGAALFDPDLFAASRLLPSLGDLLINVVLLVYVCLFARRALSSAKTPGAPFVFLLLGLGFLSAFAAWINEVMIALVRDSRIPLDLFHAQSLDGTSIIALITIAFLLFSWLLLADALVQWAALLVSARVLAVSVLVFFTGLHLVYHFLGSYDSVLILWPLPVLVALVLLRRGGSRFGYALLLVASLALLTVHVLNRQTFKRMEGDRITLAETAGTREDPMIEWLFSEARNAIQNDKDAGTFWSDSTAMAASELDARIRLRFFQSTWNNYDVRLHLFDRNGRLRGSTATEAPPTLTELRTRFEQGVPVEGDAALRNVHRPTEPALYLGAIGPTETADQGRLIIEVLPRILPEGLGFPELLMAGDRAVDRRSDRYARARYERGVLVEGSGALAFPTTWNIPLPPSDELLEMNGYELLLVGDVRKSLVVVGSAIPTPIDHLTTFSYLFLFFAILAGAFLLLRASLAWEGLPTLGVGAKLRTGILLFASLAILLFAFGAQRLLSDNYAERVAEQLDERSRSAIAELRQHVYLEQEIRPEMLRDLGHWIDKASDVLLTDIAVYSPAGELIATSREQVFNNNLLGTRMDPAAFVAMAVDHTSVFAHEERIGDAAFQAAYRPLLNDRGEVLAYLAVPYFARQSEVDDKRTAGYVAIVNLFVLLFLLSVGAATLIATWTTRPLSLLKRGLERIQLGARNEPLPYQGNDELGELVRVYNRKVNELNESAEKLARSERESAWKEMAKQVAHEIKNPLTPMKLGIQHFQLTWDPQASDAKAKLDRFTVSMVEQIDALSRVASDFSRFAQMSAANETLLDLNDVAKSAVALFAGEPNADIILHASSPMVVKADREHLLRVFNNLIKNALQAIPEERRGTIDVVLRAEADKAIAEVRDNGSGIPEEIRDHIFEPSFTTKSSGMGLGLAMVKRMVEQAGGSVHFTSRLDEGTSFFVSLPLHK